MANKYKAAIASSDGIVVNQHFGRADTFYIYEIDERGKYVLLEKRNAVPICKGGNHDNSELENNMKKLSDCRYILVSRIGKRAEIAARQLGIIPMKLLE